MPTKTVPVVLMKAGEADGLGEGQFEALVSVFDVKDSYGDVVRPGAFVESLAKWKASGNPIPVIWSHRYADAINHIGYVLDVDERTVGDKSGLWVKGQLDTGDTPEDVVARKVAKLFKGRRVTQFSFSYEVKESAIAKSEEWGQYYELRKLDLYEVGPTLIGANSDTELLAAKALRELAVELKAGRVLSAKNEELLRSAHGSIGSVLDALDSDDSKAKSGEPESGQTPMRPGPADLKQLQQIELAAL